MKLKKGDKVIVIAGKSKGQVSTIVHALPKKNMVVLDGLNKSKRHQRPTAQNRKGQIIDKVMPMHVSNVMLVDPKGGKPTRIKLKRTPEGVRTRHAVKSGEQLK
jgi:large subunit ribosomal protein L24